MIIEEQKTVKIPELDHLRTGGATWAMLWQVFYYTRLFKYIHAKQYKQIRTVFNKIATKSKLAELCDKRYLYSPRKDIYTATDKVLPILAKAGFMTETLPNQAEGKGDINELLNTEAFIQALKLPHFYTLLYFDFIDLVPDALLVQYDVAGKKYKLTFLEIEAKKPNWSEYIEKKRDKYIRLAKDKLFYDYWEITAPKLGLPIPPIDKFKFSVAFVGSIKKEFGDGFSFRERL